MGAYFANLHIRKETALENDVKTLVLEYFLTQGCVPADEGTADFEVAFYAPEDGRWMSVYSDAFTHTDILALSPRIAKAGETAVLGLACFDSDYLFLNLIDAPEGRDLWLNVGSSPEIKKPRRSNVAAWKNSVKNIEAFRAAAKASYGFAEDFLQAVEDELELPFDQSTGFDRPETVGKLYFAAPHREKELPPRLVIDTYSLMPCYPGQRECCFVNNKGGASRGLAILFVGDYIENDEITIDDTALRQVDRQGSMYDTPITFTKCQLSDGQCVYYWEDENFRIPRAVSEDLPIKVRMDKEFMNSFGLRYTPNGCKRKFLDITLVFAPLENWAGGQCAWRAWAHYPSKRAFIDQHNKTWERHGKTDLLLNPEDYDLD
ncbi:MAG: hypothetical protein J6D21_12220 [Clostridia bacterium]|nr:hypothetical protein [Clostridia bacterium]